MLSYCSLKKLKREASLTADTLLAKALKPQQKETGIIATLLCHITTVLTGIQLPNIIYLR